MARISNVRQVRPGTAHVREKSKALGQCYVWLLDLERGNLGDLQAFGLAPWWLHRPQSVWGSPAIFLLRPSSMMIFLPPSLEETYRRPTAPVSLIAGAHRDEIRLFKFMPGDLLPRRWPQLEVRLSEQLSPVWSQRILIVYSCKELKQ